MKVKNEITSSSDIISVGEQEYKIGDRYGLTKQEVNYLVRETSAFLERIRR